MARHSVRVIINNQLRKHTGIQEVKLARSYLCQLYLADKKQIAELFNIEDCDTIRTLDIVYRIKNTGKGKNITKRYTLFKRYFHIWSNFKMDNYSNYLTTKESIEHNIDINEYMKGVTNG